jgi:hypothetical protein
MIGRNSNLIQWAVALAISLAVRLPIALNRRHHVSHKESVHVFAAVVVILAFTLVIRLIFFLVTWTWHRFTQRGQPAS